MDILVASAKLNCGREIIVCCIPPVFCLCCRNFVLKTEQHEFLVNSVSPANCPYGMGTRREVHRNHIGLTTDCIFLFLAVNFNRNFAINLCSGIVPACEDHLNRLFCLQVFVLNIACEYCRAIAQRQRKLCLMRFSCQICDNGCCLDAIEHRQPEWPFAVIFLWQKHRHLHTEIS